MASLKYQAIGAAFELLSVPGVTALIRAMSGARGAIYTLHRVLPELPGPFSPNALLQITPEFLEAVIVRMRALGIDWVTLDEAIDRAAQGRTARRFAVLTFDDAYRDNLEHALPVLRRHQCPFVLYVPTALVDGKGEVWWQAIEDIIASEGEIVLDGVRLPVATLSEKRATYDRLYSHLRAIPEQERVRLIHQLSGDNGMSLFAHCRDLIMDWDELSTFVKEPLCTIGAHTVHHYELSKLSPDAMRAEIANSINVLRQRTGIEPIHFSYPIGQPIAAGMREYEMAAALGLKSAVTTIPGGLTAQHAANPFALPRISLNGHYQKNRYVDVFATPAIFTAMGARG